MLSTFSKAPINQTIHRLQKGRQHKQQGYTKSENHPGAGFTNTATETVDKEESFESLSRCDLKPYSKRQIYVLQTYWNFIGQDQCIKIDKGTNKVWWKKHET